MLAIAVKTALFFGAMAVAVLVSVHFAENGNEERGDDSWAIIDREFIDFREERI